MLRRLGMPYGAVPESLCRAPSGLTERPFERLVADYGSMFATEPPAMRALARELTLCTEPGVALYNTGLCLKDMICCKNALLEGHRNP